MSETHEQTADNVVSIRPSEAEATLRRLSVLRQEIVTAWRERGVLFSIEERKDLHSEIRETCEFLMDLTRHP